MTGATAVAAVALLVAAGLIALREGYFSALYPAPGKLSEPHSRLAGIPGAGDCRSCHDEAGISRGCLSCHEEIAGQLAGGTGFHSFLLAGQEPRCEGCHREHLGAGHELVDDRSWDGKGPTSFRHPHLADFLWGRHEALECDACHRKKPSAEFALARFPSLPRQHTFLGLEQSCGACHEDIHARGLTARCDSCHGQDAFIPTIRFDHSKRFPLEGGHRRVSCDRCHPIPEKAQVLAEENFPFHRVRGIRCADCHTSPHRAQFAADCESCHLRSHPTWLAAGRSMTADLHARTGFRLQPPHAEVSCEKCHDPRLAHAERYHDPSSGLSPRTEDACQDCHRDLHEGEFSRKGMGCLHCHERLRFKPARFGPEEHARVYPLADAHVKVECRSCHPEDPLRRLRTFAGTSRDCRDCHHSPHGGQFNDGEQDCAGCHDTRKFKPALFGLDRHLAAFPLSGSHGGVPCSSCHPESNVRSRIFKGTGTSCKACHRNPHGDQFDRELAGGDCTICHRPESDTFALRPFDHQARAGLALTGVHASADCNRCHREESPSLGAANAVPVRHYRGTPTACGSCHRDVHRGQFLVDGETRCEDCHASTERWADLKFDHDRQARFKIDGAHSKTSCGGCHPSVKLPGGSTFIQYKPLGTGCGDCHAVVRR